jgi:hypothetical protein
MYRSVVRSLAMERKDRVFHVVCRDCRTESIERTRRAARELADEHSREAGHRITFARID